MDKNYLYYNNRDKYQKICIPKREIILNYLVKEKLLSEFKTEEEKQQARDNLGVTQLLEYLILLINQRATLLDLNRYVTTLEFLRKILELKPKDEKSKGYFSSYNLLISNYPIGTNGDWAIVNINGTWYIYKYEEGIGWSQSEIYNNRIDLSEYSKLSDLNNLESILLLDLQNLQESLELGIQNLQTQIDDLKNSSEGPEIPSDINLMLSQLLENIQEEANRAQEEESNIKEKINTLEESLNKIKHKIISKKAYEALEVYEKNTLYLVVDFLETSSVFGDTFPFILGGEIDSTKFGEVFPFILN